MTRCHISAPGINKSLKKAMEQGLITKYYTFTEYGEQWLGVYGRLVERLERYLKRSRYRNRKRKNTSG